MTEENAYQVADWNGQSGERWVANQARLDAMVAVFGQAAIEAVAPATGERVLDVGCGAGATASIAAWPNTATMASSRAWLATQRSPLWPFQSAT